MIYYCKCLSKKWGNKFIANQKYTISFLFLIQSGWYDWIKKRKETLCYACLLRVFSQWKTKNYGEFFFLEFVGFQ